MKRILNMILLGLTLLTFMSCEQPEDSSLSSGSNSNRDVSMTIEGSGE